MSEQDFQYALRKSAIESKDMIAEAVRYLDYLKDYHAFPYIRTKTRKYRELYLSSDDLIGKVRDVAFSNRYSVGKKDPLRTLYKTFVRCRDDLQDPVNDANLARLLTIDHDHEEGDRIREIFEYMDEQASKDPDSFSVKSHAAFWKVNSLHSNKRRRFRGNASHRANFLPVFIDDDLFVEQEYTHDDFSLITMPEREWETCDADFDHVYRQSVLYLALMTEKAICSPIAKRIQGELPYIPPESIRDQLTYFAVSEADDENKARHKETLAQGMIRSAFAKQAEALLQLEIMDDTMSYMMEGALADHFDPAASWSENLSTFYQIFKIAGISNDDKEIEETIAEEEEKEAETNMSRMREPRILTQTPAKTAKGSSSKINTFQSENFFFDDQEGPVSAAIAVLQPH